MFGKTKEFVIPDGPVSHQWIEGEYLAGIRESQEINASASLAEINAQLGVLSGSPSGLNVVGKELRSPLLRESLYESVDANLLMVYKLAQGESAEFFSDISVDAVAIGVGGLPGPAEIKSDYVRVDTRMYVSNPYVRWNVSNLTKFDILAATQQRMKASLMLQQAAAFYRMLRYASGLRSGQGVADGLQGTTAYSNNAPASVANTSVAGSGRLATDQLAIAVANFGQRLIKGQKRLYINPGHESDLVLFNFGGAATPGGLGFFAPNTQETLLAKGNIGSFLGMDVYSDIVVPMSDTVDVNTKVTGGPTENVGGYILGPAEYVGVKVIRTDLVIETMKDATRFADVFAGWMDTGMFIRFVKAIQRLTLV